MEGNLLLIYICNLHVLSNLLLIYICKLHWNFERSREHFFGGNIFNGNSPNGSLAEFCEIRWCSIDSRATAEQPAASQHDSIVSNWWQHRFTTAWLHTGKLLLIYICNFHVLSHLLLIYICKLHWNLYTANGCMWC